MINKLSFEYNGNNIHFDAQKPIDISIPLKEGDNNVNCFRAEPALFETIRFSDFTGSVKQGGTCNYKKVQITPHGNGTHTECYGHISPDESATINNCLKEFIFFAELISIAPQKQDNADRIITFEDFKATMDDKHPQSYGRGKPEALIIRTLPNSEAKKRCQYSGTNPPYLDPEICRYLFSINVKHLLIDLPSVDKEDDGGMLKAHHEFWQPEGEIRKDCTITELIYVEDNIMDGQYLLNLQITSIESDASPSKPILYKLSI